jgi:hypothetical protein
MYDRTIFLYCPSTRKDANNKLKNNVAIGTHGHKLKTVNHRKQDIFIRKHINIVFEADKLRIAAKGSSGGQE